MEFTLHTSSHFWISFCLCSVLSLFYENRSQTSCFPFNTCAFDFSFPKSNTLHLSSFIEFHPIDFRHFPQFIKPILHSNPVLFVTPPRSVSYAIFWSFLHIPSSKLKILNKTGPKRVLCGILFDMFSQSDNKPLITALLISQIFQFCTHHIITSSKPYFFCLLMKMSCGCVSKASLKSRSITSASSSLSTGPVTLSKKEMRLLWCDLFLTNPSRLFLITLFSSRCLQIDCSIICSCIFLSIKARLTGLWFPRSSHFPFSKTGSVFAFLPSAGTSLILHELSEIIANSSEITSASTCSTPGWISRGPADLHISNLSEYSLTSAPFPCIVNDLLPRVCFTLLMLRGSDPNKAGLIYFAWWNSHFSLHNVNKEEWLYSLNG